MAERGPPSELWLRVSLGDQIRQLEAGWVGSVLDRPASAAALLLTVLPARRGSAVCLQLQSPTQFIGAIHSRVDLLPFHDADFGVIVLQHVHEFCADPARLVEDCTRLLIPGGRLLVCGFNPFAWSRWHWQRRVVSQHCRLHSVGQLNRQLRQLGLSSVPVRYQPWPGCGLETRLPLRQMQALYWLEASKRPPDLLPLRPLRLPAGAVPG